MSVLSFEAQKYSFHDDAAIFNDYIAPANLYLAENTETASSEKVNAGKLVIPGSDKEQSKEKQCVTVCDEWGKDCIINPRTGARKCRRMCKAFAKECM